MRRPILAILAFMALVACGTGQPGSPGVDRNQITRAEIDEAGPSNLYNLVQNLRPTWLQIRGARAASGGQGIPVYLDGSRVGEEDSLRGIHSDNVESLQFLSSQRASARLGMGHMNGAILVISRR
ncbi:MAG: hypothetical protein HKO65_01875 [Gemmatimonadetes bacterium]|nr:hypothetical protein [Gemmatimonadota bacterium]NNM03824.1 hypothetical protein [Gemmatimonadota bacterium]